LPKFAGARSIAPDALLQAQGAGGIPGMTGQLGGLDQFLRQLLMQMGATAPRGMPGAAGAAAGSFTPHFGAGIMAPGDNDPSQGPIPPDPNWPMDNDSSRWNTGIPDTPEEPNLSRFPQYKQSVLGHPFGR
jgi:hypothetical protein